tara:strand:+ start:551 stop:1138 length:588 start_codon:yes stop_codon:yes gene_type:complete
MLSAVAKLVERYRFEKHPSLDDLLSDKQVFHLGMFNDEQIDSFEIYTDGVVVKSRCNSKVLEAFLDDLDVWLEADLGFNKIETHAAGKAFVSDIIVEMDPVVFAALEQYQLVTADIGRNIQHLWRRDIPRFTSAGIMFAVDDTLVPGMKPMPFRLERKLGTGFEKNLFFSSAPLTTDLHFEVLDNLEERMIDMRK